MSLRGVYTSVTILVGLYVSKLNVIMIILA